MECCLMIFEMSKKSSKVLDYFVGKGVIGRMIENIVRKSPRVFVDKLEVLPDGESQIGNEIVFEKTQGDGKKVKFDNENGFVWALINTVISRDK